MSSTTITFDDEFASVIDWVHMYRVAGLQAVPAISPREDNQNYKRPAVAWKEFEDSPIPDATIERWFEPGGPHRNRTNIGLITGACSGGVFCVDLDVKEGSKADAWWHGLVETHNNGIEPETVRQRTGGGGRQILFRAPFGWSPPTFKTPIGIDIRGQGGFMVCPPSMHASGRRYEWAQGCAPYEIEIDDAPEWLIEAIEKLRAEHGGTPTGKRERAASDGDKNAFGLDQDNREEKLQLMVWGAVCDLYRACPIYPTEDEQLAERERLWAHYRTTTKSRLVKPDIENDLLLELEGRGRGELDRKWRYAMKKWDKEVRAAAAVPKPEGEFRGSTAPESEPAAEAAPSEPGRPFRASDFSGEPPERLWVVPEWIVQGAVNSLYGDGGVGKTLLAQQLACAVSKGAPWLGLPTTQGTVLAVLCEDEKDELWRRHNSIKAAMGHAIGNPFADVWLWPRVGDANVLVRWDRDGTAVLGAFYADVVAMVEEHEPSLLILDTLADVYGGNEIDRPQVNYFVKTVLGGLVKARGQAGKPLTILLLGHPSVAGKASGSGYSGSTAWNNAVRSRMYLTRPEDGPSDERVLTRGKANYATSGDETAVRLFYEAGVLKAEVESDDVNGSWVAEREAVSLTERAWRAGSPFSGKKGHPRFIYSALAEEMLRGGFDASASRQAIRACIEDGRISISNSNGKRGYKGQAND